MKIMKKYQPAERPGIISLLPLGINRVLDVGCAKGDLGKALKETGVKEVIGVEIDSSSAQQAKNHLDRVIVANVEDGHLNMNIAEESLDCIIYGDVLEHLINPWKVVNMQKKLLKNNAYIIVSFPNIRYIGTILDLLFKGKWEYQDSGILDRTHLRFFTFKSMLGLLEDSGYSIEKVYRHYSGHLSKIANTAVFNIFSDFFTRQYIFLARKL